MTQAFDDQVLAAVRELGEASVHDVGVMVPRQVRPGIFTEADRGEVMMALARLYSAMLVSRCGAEPMRWRATGTPVDMAAFEERVQ